MRNRQFETGRAVEVIAPKYGSAYRIGGRLILTAAHLLREVGSSCRIRAKQSFGEVEARVVWKAQESDIALVELNERMEPYAAVRLGFLPKAGAGESLAFQMYCYPKWGKTEREQYRTAAGGRQVEGTIYLADTSPDNLLVLEAKRLPSEDHSEDHSDSGSEWEGASGAAIICDGLVVAVQMQHQNPKRPASLEASPLQTIYNDKRWCTLLKQHAISPEPIIARHQSVSISNNLPRSELTPFQAPPLPSYYIDRPEYSEELKVRLFVGAADVRTLAVTAIHGLGSIGKSTLAAALAHDPEVRTHFHDGILWATLSQQPNLLSLLSGWIQALEDYNFKATSVEAASTHLRTLLFDKAVLLVVDDAWNTSDAQAFNIGGARCQVLITTREATIAHVLGASIYRLDVMQPSQAMELLAKKLGRSINAVETQAAEALAKELGYLPLALELAAALVATGSSWTVLLQDMQQEVARLKTLDYQSAEDASDEASLKKLSLTASLNLSIKRLSEGIYSSFVWLGILPEDVTITPTMTATLWDLDDVRDAADDLRCLHDKALLLSGVPLPDGTPTYRLHDLFHALARNLLTAPLKPKRQGDLPGLGLTLPDAHTIFLEKYQTKTANHLWHTLPDDGYIHQHLVWHLEKAKQIEAVHQLLGEQSETGGNGWYEACDQLGQSANFVTDIASAWRLTEDSSTETTLPQVISLQCRYALIIASLNSLAANLPPELLIALVQRKVWTPKQALTYVLQSSNPQKKANLLTAIANHLPPNLKELALSKALAAARLIQDKYFRAHTLISLADKLPDLLPEALAAACLIQDENSRARVLINLADKLPPNLLPEALAAARLIQDEFARALILANLADKLPDLLPEALAAARLIQDESHRALILANLADKLSQVQKTSLFALWRDTLHSLSIYTRPNLLNAINVLTPVTFTLGGQQAVKNIASAIQDVSRWWC